MPQPSAPPTPPPLRPGDPPARGDRLLLLFDANCGFCLSGRDLLRRWDRHDRLADDLIQRHLDGLLADLPADAQLATWHAIHPDGRRESGGAALAAALEQLPGAWPAARVARALPGPTDRAYRWMARHRIAISRLLRTQGHPERGHVDR